MKFINKELEQIAKGSAPSEFVIAKELDGGYYLLLWCTVSDQEEPAFEFEYPEAEGLSNDFDCMKEKGFYND